MGTRRLSLLVSLSEKTYIVLRSLKMTLIILDETDEILVYVSFQEGRGLVFSFMENLVPILLNLKGAMITDQLSNQ